MFKDSLGRGARAVDAHFAGVLGGVDDLPVTRAMGYAVSGGKGLRGWLVLESARLHDVPRDRALWPACAIEAIHAYSLVHDDLPCMDDDDLRRGRPTLHREWDEATAVLAGDALQALGFEMVSDPRCHPDAAVRADLTLSLARAAGARGMVLGQALDMAAERTTRPLTLDQITALQSGKTGALITWSAQAGARLARADLAPLTAYAERLGLAFQIADDILDVTGDADTVGKAVGKDAARGKATFVSLLGLDGAKRRAQTLVTDACDALSSYGAGADALREAARFVISRRT
ncbi:farnesyl-diphosphate synthase [Salipiger aestuarii]|uniref:Geranylgeranyl diphosphate synthase n=1 Tax=Salipiger aestuarii TaxID=568098 RepID=A0A327YLK0_9RHOB|nr:farnesyl diphosphate synthase [Salipiger aestuarii]EIE48844.1 geranyltranstransferase [Citreicella sp. 357]KAA8610398.1 farnesyl-diphosphate synthase [Salipiger aestuarii]KAA8616414.1 farnesyl-diphosphate synthase [Salipiger aestuarii]KAB2543491.1 farnesyl-diphosphate synthase [Salipiger aestuarii]RAK21944.1 farnesyl diphosphate synthase [Salipiger aestuarii]